MQKQNKNRANMLQHNYNQKGSFNLMAVKTKNKNKSLLEVITCLSTAFIFREIQII